MNVAIRNPLIGTLAVVALGVAVAAASGLGGKPGGIPDRAVPSPKTADVVRVTLVDEEDVDGEISYGDAVSLRYLAAPPGAVPPSAGATPPASGPPADDGQHLITWLPAVGSIVDRGRPVFRVDNRPVALLFGSLPLYRTVAAGVKGPDVRQLEENLRALGYTGFTVDDDVTASTVEALKRWQRASGMAATGSLAPGQAVYLPGAIRVAEHKLRVGDSASGEVLTHTGTIRKVTAVLPVKQRQYAVSGQEVTIRLADGTAVKGIVERVGQPSTGDAGTPPGGEPTVAVVIAFADQRPAGSAGGSAGGEGPVRVRFVVDERKDVLVVPVVALVALAEGGYGVQVVDGSATRYVAVETGLFSGGRVEVRSADLRPGMLVVVPA